MLRFEHTQKSGSQRIAAHPFALRFEHTQQSGSQRIAAHPFALRFEHTSNEKTLKQAWRFFV